MTQHDKLRDTLREYYDNQQVPFNEDDWDRASAYISDSRRGRNIRSSILVLGGLVAALIVTLHNFPASTLHEKSLASSPSTQTSKPVPAKQAGLNVQASPRQEIKHPRQNLRQGPRQSAHAVILVPENNSPEPTTQPPVDVAEAFIPNIAESESVLQDHQGANGEADPMDNKLLVVPVTIANGATNEGQKEAQPLNNVPPTEAAVSNDPQAISMATDTTAHAVQAAEILTLVESSNARPIADSIMTAETNGDTLAGRGPSQHLAGEGIYYEAGAAWLYGWKGADDRDAYGFSPVAGINYMNRLNNRCALSFGVQYMQVPNLSNSSKTSRVSSYIYGEQSKVTVITPSALHYLQAPLRFHYYLNAHHCFGAGINLAYLMNVDARVINYDEKPGSNENYETVKLSGYTEGFSWFDSQLTFFYRRQIWKSLALQGEIFMGLTDVKQDAFFGITARERNSGAKLSLIYYAFRKNNR